MATVTAMGDTDPAFIKPDQLDPEIKHQQGAGAVIHIFASGVDVPSHETQHFGNRGDQIVKRSMIVIINQ